MSASFLEQCSFCSKPKQEVHRLVVGPDVSICNECLALANDIVVEERSGRPLPPSPAGVATTPLEALGVLIASLPLPTTSDVLNQLTAVGLALANGQSAALRQLSHQLGAAMAYERAIEVRARIPSFDRQPTDELSDAAYHTRLGAMREALLAFDRASTTTLSKTNEVILILGRAQARLGGRPSMPSEAVSICAEADRALEALRTLEVDPLLRRGLENQHLHIRVLAAIAHGRLPEAAAQLTVHLRERPGDVEGFALLAELCERRGDLPGASAARERALTFAPRGGAYAARILGRRS